jgi:hypothetical protein
MTQSQAYNTEDLHNEIRQVREVLARRTALLLDLLSVISNVVCFMNANEKEIRQLISDGSREDSRGNGSALPGTDQSADQNKKL